MSSDITKRKTGSLAFYLSIPVAFCLGGFFLFTLLDNLQQRELAREKWLYFVSGVVLSGAIVRVVEIPWLQTLIHELKHAVMVLLTGNRVNNIEVKKHSGFVSYGVYTDRRHLEPFILLAPYCLPFLTLPCLIVCILFEGTYDPVWSVLLGFAVFSDLAGAYKDLHPHQTDLQRILGGRMFGLTYIAAINFLWLMAANLWVQSGRNGFVEASLLLTSLLGRAWREILGNNSSLNT